MTCDNCDCKIPALGVWTFRPDVNLPRRPLPEYKTYESACFDLAFDPSEKMEHIKVKNLYGLNDYAPIEAKAVETFPGNIYFFPTGIHFDIPRGYSVRIFPRSSTPVKHGLMLANSVGVVDSDYVGEILLMMTPIFPGRIEIGTRLCQAELVKVIQADLHHLNREPDKKGNRLGGIGSTGN
jgi:dUTP pyrophosphatase